jgi:NADPH-dependent ferric siderophore reductase
MTVVAPVTVESVVHLTPGMKRITFSTEGLDPETWPDQQLKLLFPPENRPLTLPPGEGMQWYSNYQSMPPQDRPIMRSFTVRARADDRLVIDFVLHDHGGPAATWAKTAKPGDTLGRYGPAAEYAKTVNLTADWVLLAGDETALPAVGALQPLLPKHAVVLVEIANESEEQDLPNVQWLHRGSAERGTRLVEAVSTLKIPQEGTTFAWLAGETSLVRTLRRDLVARGVPKKSIDFTGYWRTSLTQDDDLTEADMAELQERLAEMEESK